MSGPELAHRAWLRDIPIAELAFMAYRLYVESGRLPVRFTHPSNMVPRPMSVTFHSFYGYLRGATTRDELVPYILTALDGTAENRTRQNNR